MTLGNRLVPVLLATCVVMFAAAPYVIDRAPDEATMGIVYRIFFFHVPVAILMLLVCIGCGIASGVYLKSRAPVADAMALAFAEIAVVFGMIVLITGPLWARKSWGVWWEWEARLTITLVMWMVFGAYLLLRRFGGPGADVLSAAVGLFGGALAPFVYWSVNLWQTMHPKTSVIPSLPAAMRGPFLWCLVAFFALTIALVIVRLRLELSRVALERAHVMLEEQT
jgi:heme exporter protein C